MRKSRVILICAGLAIASFSGCKPNENGTTGDDHGKGKEPEKTNETVVEFNEDSAYYFVAKQVEFGPRVPGTIAHAKTREFLLEKLKGYCDTAFINSGDIRMHSQKIAIINNIIGSFNPASKDRIVLAAHWDTRPQADEDPDQPTTPADGANDGASGVGILLEIARQLHEMHPARGIDIIFFDQEDAGDRHGAPDSWCLGSQFWGRWVKEHNYKANWGILLDMVGAKGATFGLEAHSVRYNHNLTLDVWKTGQRLGYGSFFLNINGGMITDDHVYMNTLAEIPSIDIIHYDLTTENGFPAHWHRHTDNMDAIDKYTLKAVGQTVLHVVANRK
ncbi:MAG: M28 family peptidase [Bacteroidetes bacterium]|nr:M28 family peptidase [Bacteroidota bacterium]